MTPPIFIKRYSKLEQVFHLGLMLTFLASSATGISRLFITTAWGEKLSSVFGGYETSFLIHQWSGILMTVLFMAHIIYLITKINWQNPVKSIFGPDSMVPNFQDGLHLLQRFLWFFGLCAPPKFDRFAYSEKFGYWAVFWGIPLLAITGLMLMYPLLVSRLMPGWIINIIALLHRAEAILAISYVFIVHFIFGHLSPSKFPFNEAMFSGVVALEEVMEEKPAWMERLKKEGKIELLREKPPALWYRVLYFIYGYAALSFGVYLLINVIVYSRYINLH